MMNAPSFAPPATLSEDLREFLLLIAEDNRAEFLDMLIESAERTPKGSKITLPILRTTMRRFKELCLLRISLSAMSASLHTGSNSYQSMLCFAGVYRLAGLDFARWAHGEIARESKGDA